MNDLVSIIVPIYKVEPYLRRCLDSIVNQTYTNLEIILVDDGSPDGCPQICDEYAANDNRIIVIHKENGGLSDARNTGLDVCKGEYISFVDSDDWTTPTYIEHLLKAIKDNNAEIAVCNYTTTKQNCTINTLNTSIPEYEILTPTLAVKKLWSKDYVTFVTAWGKLYKKSLFTGIYFPKGKIHEDKYTTYKLLYQSNKTVFLKELHYFYFQRNDSITAKTSSSSIRILEAQIERYFFFKEHKENEIIELCLKTLCWDLLFAYSLCKSTTHGYSAKDLLTLYKTSVNDYANVNKSSKHLKYLKLFARIPILYIIYRKFSPYKIRLK